MNEIRNNEEKCENEYCNNEGTLFLHNCPYAEDVNGDSEAVCNCCSECENNCIMDI